MNKPPFVMSMYMNKETLYKAKAEYYLDRCEQLEAHVYDLHNILHNNYTFSKEIVEVMNEANKLLTED